MRRAAARDIAKHKADFAGLLRSATKLQEILAAI